MVSANGSKSAATIYADAISSQKPLFLPALMCLHQHKICSRCCLRFAAVRSEVYAQPAPNTEALLKELENRISTQKTNKAEGQSRCDLQDLPVEASLDEPKDSAIEPACRLCLGILQSLDGPIGLVSNELRHELPETDGGGTPWTPVRDGTVEGIAQCISGVGVELSVPASTQLRQLSMWYHLRSLEDAAHLFPGESLRDSVVDLKEALKLRGVVVQRLAEMLGKPLEAETGDFHVLLSYIHPPTAPESDFLFGRPHNARSQRRKRRRVIIDIGRSSSEAMVNAAAMLDEEKFREQYPVPPREVDSSGHLLLSAKRKPLYIGGQYRKLQRDISQTPWFIDGERKGRTSVQEEIERYLLPALRCDACKFITAGREDMDVRMLGNGRPFVMEIQNQRAAMPSSEFFSKVEQQLEDSGVGVEVCKLQPVQKEKLKLIKEGEQTKQKSYEAICELPCEVTADMLESINTCSVLELAQTTPARVQHSRALLVRHRKVYSMRGSALPDKSRLLLNLRTQAGTYIKEFVHGDNGLTQPHLGEFLGCSQPAKILQLDVLEIHIEFL